LLNDDANEDRELAMGPHRLHDPLRNL